LGKEGANSIVEVAKDKPHFITLCGLMPDQKSADFSKQGLGVGDGILLAFDLKKNSVLVDLNLSDNILTNHGWDMSGIIQIAEALKVNTTLQSIDLRDNGLDDKAKRLLRQAAPHVTFTF